jgi:hypothetical protein
MERLDDVFIDLIGSDPLKGAENFLIVVFKGACTVEGEIKLDHQDKFVKTSALSSIKFTNMVSKNL